ncbi:MAG TPA: kelch repeat-containing protein [Myxococcaceae bacterium]
MTPTCKSRCWLALPALLLLGACGSSGGNGGNGGGPDAGGNGPDAGLVTPTAPGWEALHQMPFGQGESAIAAWEGKIYVAGGYDTSPTFLIYDLATDSWRTGPALLGGTDNAGAVASQGKIWVFGGEASPRVQIYGVAAGAWSDGPALPGPRFSSVVELVGSAVHLVGGWSFDRSHNVSISSHTVFDLSSGTYPAGPFAAMGTARNHAYSGVIDGKLYVTGGRAPGHEGSDGTNLAVTEVYDPGADGWTTLEDLPTPRSGGASAVLGGKLYVMGGQLPGNTLYKAVHRFDPATGHWEALPDMPIELTGHRAVAVGNALYVMGGFSTRNGMRQGFDGVPYVWRYTPP